MASASPFSFHCMICFEEFDAVNRYPVVLPCGHTYICIECADRLDKCMECRTSLFQVVVVKDIKEPAIIAPQSTTGRRGYNKNRRVRDPMNEAMRQHEIQQNKPQKTKKERLPLPKNAVLLSLMEATEFTSENVEMASQIAPSKGETVDKEEVVAEDEEEEEEQRILQNLSIVTSACGTYAVACKENLKIVSSRPYNNKSRSRSMSPLQKLQKEDLQSTRFHRVLSNIDRDVDRLVKATNITPTRKTRRGPICEGSLQSESESSDSLDSMTLSYGDRIQVVSINDGWAKLARGYGFVYCKNGTELVKVGNAADKACRIEAILHTLALRRNKLKREQDEIDSEGVGLMKTFQNSLMRDDDITVIDASSFTSFSVITNIKENSETNFNSIKTEKPTKPPMKPTSPTRQARSDNNESRGCSMFKLSPSNIFSRFYAENDENRSPDSTRQQQLDSVSAQSSTTPAAPLINSTMLEGAREWRRKNSKHAARGINFRTGMSGHMGVHSTYTHPHDYLCDSRRKMSSHSGLTIAPRKPSSSRLDIPAVNWQKTL